ncbi:MAG: hypothetical protein WCJ30_21975 [Deltaproteobacteria bacterium]
MNTTLHAETRDRRSLKRLGIATLTAAMWGCGSRTIPPVDSGYLSPFVEVDNRPENVVDRVDLLLMVDNSNSMRDNQSNIMSQFQTPESVPADPGRIRVACDPSALVPRDH